MPRRLAVCFAAVLLLVLACVGSEFKDPSTLCAAEEGTMTATSEITAEYSLEVVEKHVDLFKRQPNYWGVGPANLLDKNGKETGIRGIIISVTEKVDQSTLPAEDRIPDCLEGVPVQFEEGPKPVLLGESPEDTGEEQTDDRN